VYCKLNTQIVTVTIKYALSKTSHRMGRKLNHKAIRHLKCTLNQTIKYKYNIIDPQLLSQKSYHVWYLCNLRCHSEVSDNWCAKPFLAPLIFWTRHLPTQPVLTCIWKFLHKTGWHISETCLRSVSRKPQRGKTLFYLFPESIENACYIEQARRESRGDRNNQKGFISYFVHKFSGAIVISMLMSVRYLYINSRMEKMYNVKHMQKIKMTNRKEMF
jgi:predicted transcriptional regulator with HTH domain